MLDQLDGRHTPPSKRNSRVSPTAAVTSLGENTNFPPAPRVMTWLAACAIEAQRMIELRTVFMVQKILGMELVSKIEMLEDEGVMKNRHYACFIYKIVSQDIVSPLCLTSHTSTNFFHCCMFAYRIKKWSER
jgi:hypothetical protein